MPHQRTKINYYEKICRSEYDKIENLSRPVGLLLGEGRAWIQAVVTLLGEAAQPNGDISSEASCSLTKNRLMLIFLF